MTRREMTVFIAAAAAVNSKATAAPRAHTVPQPVSFDSIDMSGEFANRTRQNSDCAKPPYYEPPQVVQDLSQKCPCGVGNVTVLAASLLSGSTPRNAIY